MAELCLAKWNERKTISEGGAVAQSAWLFQAEEPSHCWYEARALERCNNGSLKVSCTIHYFTEHPPFHTAFWYSISGYHRSVLTTMLNCPRAKLEAQVPYSPFGRGQAPAFPSAILPCLNYTGKLFPCFCCSICTEHAMWSNKKREMAGEYNLPCWQYFKLK